MREYQPWDDSWRDQLVYIMVPYEIDAPVEVPANFTYPMFLKAFEKKIGGDVFWKTVAGAMVYVIGHQPDHPEVSSYVQWLNSYNKDIVRELIYDGAEQASKDSLDAAVWLFQAAVLLDPELAESHFNLGLAYNQLGLSLLEKDKKDEGKRCFIQATQYLKNAVELDPKLSLAYYNLGFIYKKMGLQDEGQKYIEKGLLLGTDRLAVQDGGENDNCHQ